MPRFDQLPPNLIRIICECLIQPSEGLERRLANRSLVALALTCHAVLEPALDTIWHTLPDMNVVISTIPRKRCKYTVRVATHGGDGFYEPVMNVVSTCSAQPWLPSLTRHFNRTDRSLFVRWRSATWNACGTMRHASGRLSRCGGGQTVDQC